MKEGLFICFASVVFCLIFASLSEAIPPDPTTNPVYFSLSPTRGPVGQPISFTIKIHAENLVYNDQMRFEYWMNDQPYCQWSGTPTGQWHSVFPSVIWAKEEVCHTDPISFNEAGKYIFIAWARSKMEIDNSGSEQCSSMIGIFFEAIEGQVAAEGLATVTINGSGKIGEPIEIIYNETIGQPNYKFWVNTQSYCNYMAQPAWVPLQSGSMNSYVFVPEREGLYTFVVWTDPDSSCPGMLGGSFRVMAQQ